jgi:hypothetical protein
VEKAFLAADLVRGQVVLRKPTIKQAAELLRVSPAYVAAVAIGDDDKARSAVLRGPPPLVMPLVKSEPPPIRRSEPMENSLYTWTATPAISKAGKAGKDMNKAPEEKFASKALPLPRRGDMDDEIPF